MMILCDDRLKRLGYTDMEMRRKGGRIQLYKIAKGIEKVEIRINITYVPNC